MNVVATKLKDAGVKLPTVKYRIWNWLRDHPEKTVADITVALGLGYEPSQAVLEMEKAGVLKVYSDMSRTTGHYGQSYKIKRYSVTNTNEYEHVTLGMLNKSKKPERTAQPAKVTTIRSEVAPIAAVATSTQGEFNPQSVVADLSFGQVLAVYNYLKGVLA